MRSDIRRPLRRLGIVTFALLLLAAVSARPAGAHAEILAADPGHNSVVAEISTITAKFVLAEEVTLTLIGPDGAEVPALGDTELIQLDAVRSFEPPTLPGRYEVRWVALGTDGDVVDGRYVVNLDPELGSDTGDTPVAVFVLIGALVAAMFFLFVLRRGRVRRLEVSEE